MLDGDSGELIVPQIDLGEIDSGDGLTFARFLAWSIQQYPAVNYAVALGGHGAGWRGIVTDEINHSILTLPELEAAFLTAQALLDDDQRMPLLINDACLMSSIEYHTTVTPFFDISYASPEIVVNPALDMTRLLNTIRMEAGDVDLTDLGVELTTVYMEEDMTALQNPFVSYLSHVVTDLTRHDDVVQALDDFAALFLSDPQRYALVLGEARSNTYTYSAFMNQSELIDLGHFMHQVIAQNPGPAMVSAAQQVIDSLDDVRLQAVSGERMVDDAAYYNIYFPARSADLQVAYLLESPLSNWGQMLRTYYQEMTNQVWAYIDDVEFTASITPTDIDTIGQIAFHAPIVPKVMLSSAYPPVGNVNTSFAVQTTIIGRNIARGQFTADYIHPDGGVQRLMVAPIYTVLPQPDGFSILVNSWQSGVEIGSFTWDAMLDVLDDGTNRNLELFTFTDDTAALQGRYRLEDQAIWYDVTVLFDYETGEVQRVIEQNANAFADIAIPDGAIFQTYHEFVTGDGRTVREPGAIYDWNNLRIEPVAAPDGAYSLRFEVITHGGVSSGDTFNVQVDNSGVIEGVTGFIELDDGFSLSLPPDWFEMEIVQDELAVYYLSNDPDATAFMLVWQFDSPESALADIAFDFIDYIYDTVPDVFEFSELSGLDAIYFEGSTRLGYEEFIAGYIVIHQDMPLAFVMEGRAGTPEFEIGLQFIEQTVSLFEFDDRRIWDIGVLFDATFPIPMMWLDTLDYEDIWDAYTPPDDESGLIRVRVTEVEVDFGVTGDDEAQSRELSEFLVETYLPANYTVVSEEIYFGEFFIWQALLYIDEERGVRGRMYVTAEGNTGYAVWVEAPLSDRIIFAEIFEPILDGFKIE